MATKVYTMQDWERDGVLSLSIGQPISDEVFYALRDCVPPTLLRWNLFQVGEASDHDTEFCAPLYRTFQKNEQGQWINKGLCLYMENIDREQYGYGHKMGHRN